MSELIKRKDGSYSRRGLWDNIRANKGSGKKPTKEMLAQERKIKNMQDGGSIPERYRNMGFSRVGQKKASTNEGKKWMVLAKKGDQYKVVHGGYKGMQDFKQHGSEQRKENFWNRMGGRDSSKATDPFSPLYWHKRLGTWEEGGRLPQYEDGGWFQKLLENLNPFTWFEDAPETYSQAFAKARSKGLDKFTWNNKEYTTALKQETAKPKVVKPVVKVEEKKLVSSNEFPSDLLLRQAHKESGGFRPDVISGKTLSSANAKGLAQIRPIALDEYYRLSKQPVGSIDLTNPEDNVKVQKFLMNEHYNSGPATKGNPTEEVRRAKSLAFFNKGRAGVIDVLNKAKEEGHDIYKSLSWIDKLPVETSDYIRKILLRTIPEHEKRFHRDTTNSPYNKLYGFKIGGQLPKLQDGNKVPSKKATYDSESDTYDLGSLNAVTVTGKAPRDSFGRRMTPEQLAFNQRIHNAQGQALSNLMRFTASGPQQLMMYGLTGKAQYPSEAIGYKNPEGFWQNTGNIGIDILTDPLGGPATVKGLYNLGKAGAKGFAKSTNSGLLSNPKVSYSIANTPDEIDKAVNTEELLKNIETSNNTIRKLGSQYINEIASPEGTRRLRQQLKEANPSLNEEQLNHLVIARLNEISMATNFNKSKYLLNHQELIKDGKFSTENDFPVYNAHWSPYNLNPEVTVKQPPQYLFPESGGMPQSAKFNLKKSSVFDVFTDPVEAPGSIALGEGLETNKMVLDHELAHAIQKGGVMPIDAELQNLLPSHKYIPEHIVYGRQSARDKAYFNFSGGRQYNNEAYPFLVEQRRKMIERGILNDRYDKVTPWKLLQARIAARNNTLLNFMEGDRLIKFTPFWKYPGLAKIMNKAPGVAVGAGLGASQLPKQKHGGVITDSRGQWAHPGKVTRIPSNTITMQGVDTPLLGISDKGEQKVMMPNQNYKFANAKYVTEYPLKEKGGIMNKLGDTSNNRRNLLKQGVGANLYPLPFAKGGKMYKQGGIFIKPENRGKFTAWAKSKGMGVQEAASQVMANKEEYSPTIVKRANFAKNAAGWNKAQGGRMAMNYNLGNMNIEPKSYAQGGGIDNPGFKSLPDFVQAKIKANMEAGGVMRYRMGGKTKFNKMC